MESSLEFMTHRRLVLFLVLLLIGLVHSLEIIENERTTVNYTTTDVSGGALNILNGLSYPHHPVMLAVPLRAYPLIKGLLNEINGLIVPVTYDCGNFREAKEPVLEHDYFNAVPSRWLQCYQHHALIKSGMTIGTPLYPIVDEEYVENVAIFQSILRSKPDDPYVFAELGARWGTWGFRSAAFLRSIRPIQEYSLYFVEPVPESCDAIKTVGKLNGFSFSLDCSYASFDTFSKWADSVNHIDVIDIDIQSFETQFIPEVMSILNDKAYRVILGTHDEKIHPQMLQLFEANNWIVVNNSPFSGDVYCVSRYVRGNCPGYSCPEVYCFLHL